MDSVPSGPVLELVSSAELAGDSVVNTADEDLGHLEELLIDVSTGRVAYAVLSCGGVFGIGARLFAVPWESLTHDPERGCFVLDVSRESLESIAG